MKSDGKILHTFVSLLPRIGLRKFNNNLCAFSIDIKAILHLRIKIKLIHRRSNYYVEFYISFRIETCGFMKNVFLLLAQPPALSLELPRGPVVQYPQTGEGQNHRRLKVKKDVLSKWHMDTSEKYLTNSSNGILKCYYCTIKLILLTKTPSKLVEKYSEFFVCDKHTKIRHPLQKSILVFRAPQY